MKLTKEQTDQMIEAAKPLVKFLCENCHPHVHIVIDSASVELFEGQVRVSIEEFIQD